ncbi:MAG: hypothetical protein ACREV6_06050 [Clostridium sp.]|uniref:hypothetical protein n=1 Tax=Clostridium sp. TaxID=1506 RepID=UPI003D6D773C
MTVNISKHENELVVSFDYSQERIAKVKSIKGHKWNANDCIKVFGLILLKRNRNFL